MTDHVLLVPDAHRELRIQTRRSAGMGDAVMCAIVVPDEFRRAQGHYPILFRRDVDRDEFNALAMFGFENGENLFLADDRWEASYLPLSIDIQPFLIGGSPDDDAPKQVLVDMASPRIAPGDEGMRVFDEFDRPTPYLEAMVEKLGALDEGYRASRDFYAALARYDLLEPLTLEITMDDGSINRLVGFHIIDEARLQALDGATLGDLHQAGHLMPIFMALASIGRVGELVARKNRKLRHG